LALRFAFERYNKQLYVNYVLKSVFMYFLRFLSVFRYCRRFSEKRDSMVILEIRLQSE